MIAQIFGRPKLGLGVNPLNQSKKTVQVAKA
jgi:hypothetical protein